MPHPATPSRLGRRFGLALLPLALVFQLVGCSSPPPSTPLYQQLGGVQGIESISRAALQRMATDPRTKRTFDGINLRTLSASLASYLCKVADGPCVYEGETMRKSHADLGLGGAEFEATVQILRDELDRAGVSQGAKNELLRRLAPTRRDMVAADR